MKRRARRVRETKEVRRVAEVDKNDKKARPDFRSLATFWPYARAQKARMGETRSENIEGAMVSTSPWRAAAAAP